MVHIHGGDQQPDANKAAMEAALTKAIQSPAFIERLANSPEFNAFVTKVTGDVVREKWAATDGPLNKARDDLKANMHDMHARLDKVIEQCSPKLPNYAPAQPDRRWEN